jgi:hypothetical protein
MGIRVRPVLSAHDDDERTHRREYGRPDACDGVEIVDRAEFPARLAGRDDPAGERRADARQALELGCARRVEVERPGRSNVRDCACRSSARSPRRRPSSGLRPEGRDGEHGHEERRGHDRSRAFCHGAFIGRPRPGLRPDEPDQRRMIRASSGRA